MFLIHQLPQPSFCLVTTYRSWSLNLFSCRAVYIHIGLRSDCWPCLATSATLSFRLMLRRIQILFDRLAPLRRPKKSTNSPRERGTMWENSPAAKWGWNCGDCTLWPKVSLRKKHCASAALSVALSDFLFRVLPVVVMVPPPDNDDVLDTKGMLMLTSAEQHPTLCRWLSRNVESAFSSLSCQIPWRADVPLQPDAGCRQSVPYTAAIWNRHPCSVVVAPLQKVIVKVCAWYCVCRLPDISSASSCSLSVCCVCSITHTHTRKKKENNKTFV